MTTNVDLFVSEEIIWEHGPWCEQDCQVLHRIEVEDHDVGQNSHFGGELNCVQGLLLELSSKNLHERLKFLFSLVIV